jgi:hypothetical protein
MSGVDPKFAAMEKSARDAGNKIMAAADALSQGDASKAAAAFNGSVVDLESLATAAEVSKDPEEEVPPATLAVAPPGESDDNAPSGEGDDEEEKEAKERDLIERWKGSPTYKEWENAGSIGEPPEIPADFKFGGGKKKKKRGGKSLRKWKKNKKGGRQSKKRRY